MKFRISPVWWPLLILLSPVFIPFIIIKAIRFKKNSVRAKTLNQQRIQNATALDLPELDYLNLTVIVEEKTADGFVGDAGVSYLFKSNLGSLLFDVGFGPERPAFMHNAEKLNININELDSLAISHLHPDHMGGMGAMKNNRVSVPGETSVNDDKRPCYLPDKADSEYYHCEIIEKPQLLSGGIASTGPLARSLFFFGHTEEQAIVARVKGKGLVVFTGCGHPTVDVILNMVSKLSDEPVYAFGGGLHFPVTGGRGNRLGIQFQTIVGTGKPPWKRITDTELNRTIDTINEICPKKVLLSGHDSCDYSLETMQEKLRSESTILKAGETYQF